MPEQVFVPHVEVVGVEVPHPHLAQAPPLRKHHCLVKSSFSERCGVCLFKPPPPFVQVPLPGETVVFCAFGGACGSGRRGTCFCSTNVSLRKLLGDKASLAVSQMIRRDNSTQRKQADALFKGKLQIRNVHDPRPLSQQFSEMNPDQV